jgi:hypothetical protein
MTIADALIQHPFDESVYKSKNDYILYIVELTGANYDSVTRTFRTLKPLFRVTSKTLDKNNEVISTTEKIVIENEVDDLSKFEATKLTTNPYGGQWVKYEKKQVDYFDVKEKIIEELKQYSPVYPVIKRIESEDGHLMVVDPADIHIGKLCRAFETGDEYNTEIAVNRVIEGVNGLISKSKGFKIDKVLLIIGNDILHIDTPKRTTTSGTPQDTCGMWYDNFLSAKNLYVKVIELLLQVADVDIHYNPSNHDYTNGFFLADTLKSWFSKCKQITFNTDISHRKYYRYGNSLIGTTHGDGAKESDLPLLMAQESKDWSECKHRYFYIHHIHHKKSKDYGSVCVESLRSPSGTDSWHHRNGYQHSPKSVEMFIHSKNDGQIARITHIF